MDTNSHLGLPTNRANSVAFFLSFRGVVPCIDTVYPDLTPDCLKALHPIRQLRNIVRNGSTARMLGRNSLAHSVFEWDEIICRSEVFFYFQVPFERKPVISLPTQIDQRERSKSRPA